MQNEDVSKALGELPKEKLFCSNIAANELHNTIENHLSKSKL